METSQSRIGGNSYSFNNNSCNNNTDSFNITNNTTLINNVRNINILPSADERAEILTWLSQLEPQIRHKDIRDNRVEHVGDWLFLTEEYQNWFGGIRSGESDNSALLCYGAPGVGKTFISSLVIDRLCDWASGQNAAVACFYFDFAAQKEQSPTSVLGSLLRQVVGGLEKIPAKVVHAFRDQGKVIGGRKLELSEIVEMLQSISSWRPTVICIDALDECMAEYRGKLLDSLEQILHKSPDIRIFLAGRFHIRDEIEKCLAGRVVAVSVTPSKDDIIRFLQAKLREDTTPDEMDKSLEADIINSIPEAVSEIFLLASLNIKAILQETTLYRRREKLGAMTNGSGLGDVYDATIGRIKAQEGDRSRLGIAALMWISHSEQPLKVDEICHALAVQIGSAHMNTSNVPSIRTVLSCCQGLAAVDNRSSTIRLIHFTLKEYLSGRADLFGRAHSKMAETCLTYLNFRTIKELPTSPSPDPRGTPFLEYSSLYWGTHMRIDLSDHSKYLALSLLDQYDSHISAELLWKSIVGPYFNSLEPFSALHCISYFGIAEVATDLTKMKRWNVNQRDSAGLTPLMWAAMYGHEGVVNILLQQRHTQPDIPDMEYGRTALLWAAGGGHEGVVRLFLGRLFVNPWSMGRRWGKTAQVMNLIFRSKYINPDKPDNNGQTPLSWATRNGHDGVVKLLLRRRDVSSDRPDNCGRTPLLWASQNGHDGVVKLLLELKDISPDWRDYRGQTPLSRAAWNGHDGVVRLLLGRKDVSPDVLDNYGQTPLSWAAWNGHDGVAKLLLAREDVSPDRPDLYGQTPLSWAAGGGCVGVVKLLLAREEVSPDKPDNGGQTPLSWAARGGYSRAVELLLEREDVNPHRPDNRGQKPLWWATRGEHSRVVELLSRQE